LAPLEESGHTLFAKIYLMYSRNIDSALPIGYTTFKEKGDDRGGIFEEKPWLSCSTPVLIWSTPT